MGAARKRRMEARTKRQESLRNRGITVEQNVTEIQVSKPIELEVKKVAKIVTAKVGRPHKLTTNKNHTGNKKTDGAREKE